MKHRDWLRAVARFGGDGPGSPPPPPAAPPQKTDAEIQQEAAKARAALRARRGRGRTAMTRPAGDIGLDTPAEPSSLPELIGGGQGPR